MRRYLDAEKFLVGRGLVDDYSYEQIFGYNDNCTNGAEEFVWSGPATDYVWAPNLPATPDTLTVRSLSALDTSRQILVEGISNTGYEISEMIVLDANDATVNVSSTQEFFRINRALHFGPKNLNANIEIYCANTLAAHIKPEHNRDLSAVWTMPIDQQAYVMNGEATSSKGADAQIKVYFAFNSGVLLTADITQLYQAPYQKDHIICPIMYPLQTMFMTSLVDTGGAKVGVNFNLIHYPLPSPSTDVTIPPVVNPLGDP